MFDTDTQVIPPNLDSMEPGPALAAFLSVVDIHRLSDHDRVIVLRAHHRLASHHTAQAYQAMAAISDAIHEHEVDYQLAHESAAAEIGTALRLTRRAADCELDLALDLRRRLPAVYRLLYEGLIDPRRARVIAQATSHLSVAAAQQVTAAIIDDAPNLTTGQLRSRIRRRCIDQDPDDARERYEHATTQRRLVSEPTPDGTAHLLGLDLPPDKVQQARDRINRLAQALSRDGQTRSMDQLRADVFLDLLTGTQPAKGGTVDIRVDLETLTQLSENSGDLAGYGPVIADLARQVAQQAETAEWRYTVTHPDGTTTTGITRRRPTAHQQRAVQSRDTTCIFPGCRMPATQSDLDHTTRHTDGGPTREHNLAPLCRHHHRLRETGWTYKPIGNGVYRWTSTLGHTYTARGRPP